MNWIIKYRWLIIVSSLVLTLGVSGLLHKIEIDPDLKNYFPESMESMVNTELIEENFGNQDIVMLIFEGENIVSAESLNRIKKVDRKLKRAEGIRKTSSLFESNRIYGENGAMYVEATVKRIPRNKDEEEALKVSILDNDLVKNVVIADDFKSAAIIATLSEGANEDSVFTEIKQILEEYPGEEKVHFGGLPYIRQSINKDIKRDGLILIPAALLLMVLFLYLVFREWRGVSLPFMVVIMSSLLALALIPLIGWKFYIITLLVPVMLIAVANDYGIHIIAKYQEINATDHDMSMKEIAVIIAEKLWRPILLTGITTIAGVAALLAHTMIPARQMAVMAGIGILFALFYSIVLLPAILSLLKRSKSSKLTSERKNSGKRSLLNRLSYFIIKHFRVIPKIALGVTIVIGLGISFLQVDSNEENFFPEKHPVKQAASIINKHYGGSANLSIMFTGDMFDPVLLEKIDAYAQKLKKRKEIDLTMAFPDVIIEISKALNDPGTEWYDRIPPSRDAVAQYIELYNMNGDPENLDQLVDFNYEKSHMIIRINSASNRVVNDIIDDIKVMTAGDENVTAIGGTAFIRSELATKVVQGQFYSLGIALVVILIILSIIFKSFTAGLISCIPVFMSIVLLFGVMGITGVKLDIATALLSSLMIGVGVDYTIHFLWRFREERMQNRQPKEALLTTLTTTGRGILFNAHSVIVGFIILTISSFTPIRFFGMLVVISILGCLIGALVILPALVLKYRFAFLEPGEKTVQIRSKEKFKKTG